jgi:hypothetical protein
MPTYRITILDKNWEDVREKIEMNLQEIYRENERMKSSRLIKPFLVAFKKALGLDFDIFLNWEWVEDKVCIFTIFAPIPLKEEFYDKDVKKFGDLGKISIERLDSNNNVVAKVL